jgi:HrpA-like RNA helicase
MITGDATVNHDAPVICCTAEILANIALRDGAHALVDDVIMDEFHYYSDHSRGAAWQIPLLTLPRARFLLMSANLGDSSFFSKQLTALTGATTTLVQSDQRPVPLEFEYSTTQFQDKVAELNEQGRSPVYLVHFTQNACADTARDLLKVVCGTYTLGVNVRIRTIMKEKFRTFVKTRVMTPLIKFGEIKFGTEY